MFLAKIDLLVKSSSNQLSIMSSRSSPLDVQLCSNSMVLSPPLMIPLSWKIFVGMIVGIFKQKVFQNPNSLEAKSGLAFLNVSKHNMFFG